ncbi:MAG: hypothetical protein ABIO92_03510 [Chloroflexia bacterium]
MPDESDSANSSSQSGKVISLRGHQAAEQVVDDLLSVGRSDPRFISLTAKAFSLGAPLLSAVARRLDTDRPKELLLLSEVAGRYPGRGQAVRTLIRAANDRRASDTRRLGAALALGMHDYGVILPPLHDFLGGLSSPASVFASALMSALDDYSHSTAPQEWEPLFALFLSQPPEVLFSVIGALGEVRRADISGTTSVLQLLALNSHPDVMAAAVEALMGQTDEASVRALATLQPNLPADMGHLVGRQLQKLRLSGIYDPSPSNGSPPGIQARLSAVDGRGRCLLSLAQEDKSRVIELILSDTQGIIDAALNPVTQAEGGTGSIRHPLYGEQASHRGSLVVVPIGYTLDLLRRVVRSNWLSGTGLPVAYLLECGAIWEAAREIGDSQEEAAPDLPGADQLASSEDESALLSSSSFTDWYLDTPATHLAAHEIAVSTGGLSSKITDENWRILLPSIIRLAHDEFVPEQRALYANRLRMMADWLYFGGQHTQSSLAASAAHTMTHSPPEANLFVLRLVQKGILVALTQL